MKCNELFNEKIWHRIWNNPLRNAILLQIFPFQRHKAIKRTQNSQDIFSGCIAHVYVFVSGDRFDAEGFNSASASKVYEFALILGKNPIFKTKIVAFLWCVGAPERRGSAHSPRLPVC